MERLKRVWLGDAGGDQVARLEFLAEQGLRLIMADVSPRGREALHFYNPRDGETLHLVSREGGGVIRRAAAFFPEARRWLDMMRGGEEGLAGEEPGTPLMPGDGILLAVSGGRVRRVSEIRREYPQGGLLARRSADAVAPLEESGGVEGPARTVAFLQAAEEARGMVVPATAMAFRAVTLEVSRVYAHLLWISELCGVLGRKRLADSCDNLRRGVEEGMAGWLGHPLGRNWMVPGGLREGFPLEGAGTAAECMAAGGRTWGERRDDMLSLPVPAWAERRLRPRAAEAAAAGWVGPLARAAGLERDVRAEEPCPCAGADWRMEIPPERGGLLGRMLAIKAGEIASSLAMAGRILEDMPEGELRVERGRGGNGRGFGRCEGPGGELCCHLALEKGRVAYMAMSLPGELNRSASAFLEGSWLDEMEVLSLLWTDYGIPRREPAFSQ